MLMSMQRRKRVVLSLKDKLDIIECLKYGEPGRDLARRYNVGSSTISDIKKNSSLILAYTKGAKDACADKKIMKLPKNDAVDESLHSWFLENRSKGIDISEKLLYEKAIDISRETGNEQFVVNNVWLKQFMTKYGISEKIKQEPDQSESEEETSVLEPDSELWGFFDKEPRNRAKCSMCGVRLSRDPEVLYKHLKEKHSKISENLEFKDNDESYTEVIYLEDPMDTSKTDKKPRYEQKVLSEVQPKAKKPSKRRYSYKDEVKSYQKPEQIEKISKDELEIENFGKYITVLLKGVNRSSCTQLQMDIVNLIMTAKLNIEPTAPNITISSVVEEDKEKERERDEEMGEARYENQANHENQENLESFTEVPITNENQFDVQKQGMDSSQFDTPPTKRPKRRFSYREEYTYKVDLTEKEEKEVENFGKYVTCLLKSITHKDTGNRLQMEIVNLIMTARLKVMKKTSPVLTINGTIEIQNKDPENQEPAAFAEV